MTSCLPTNTPSSALLPAGDTFDVDAQNSETLRQADIAAAAKASGYGTAWGQFDKYSAGVQAASAAHYRRLCASALANGRDVAGFLAALKSVGAA